jgi:hypothetical protein
MGFLTLNTPTMAAIDCVNMFQRPDCRTHSSITAAVVGVPRAAHCLQEKKKSDVATSRKFEQSLAFSRFFL